MCNRSRSAVRAMEVDRAKLPAATVKAEIIASVRAEQVMCAFIVIKLRLFWSTYILLYRLCIRLHSSVAKLAVEKQHKCRRYDCGCHGCGV